MASRIVTVSLGQDVYSRLVRASESAGQTAAAFAAVLVEEGLRMQSHPDIIFRDGPTGRRPGLTYGPDVWEVARVLREMDWTESEDKERAQYLTGLSARWLDAAQKYYAAYSDEIDAWIDRVDREAEATMAAINGKGA